MAAHGWEEDGDLATLRGMVKEGSEKCPRLSVGQSTWAPERSAPPTAFLKHCRELVSFLSYMLLWEGQPEEQEEKESSEEATGKLSSKT